VAHSQKIYGKKTRKQPRRRGSTTRTEYKPWALPLGHLEKRHKKGTGPAGKEGKKKKNCHERGKTQGMERVRTGVYVRGFYVDQLGPWVPRKGGHKRERTPEILKSRKEHSFSLRKRIKKK